VLRWELGYFNRQEKRCQHARRTSDESDRTADIGNYFVGNPTHLARRMHKGINLASIDIS